MKAMETGRGVPMKDIFDKTLGDDLDSKKTLSELFDDTLGRGRKKAKGKGSELHDVFKDAFGEEEGEEKDVVEKPREDRSLTEIYRDVFVRKVPMEDHFKMAFPK